MKIETMYNIGQEVWIKVQSKPTKVTIKGIYKPVEELLFLVENDDLSIALEERYLFPTKEGLIKSL